MERHIKSAEAASEDAETSFTNIYRDRRRISPKSCQADSFQNAIVARLVETVETPI